MVLSGCRIRGNLTYENIHLEGGTHRRCSRTKEQQQSGESKANPRGVDVHLRGYQAGRKIDNSAIGVVWMRYASERDRSKLTKQLRIQRPVPWRRPKVLRREGALSYFSRGVRIGQGSRSRDERPNIDQNRQDAKRCDGASENKCARKNAGALDQEARHRWAESLMLRCWASVR